MKIRLGLEFSIKKEPPTAEEILEVLSEADLIAEVEEMDEPEDRARKIGFQPNE